MLKDKKTRPKSGSNETFIYLEESKFLFAVRNQHVLGLAVMRQHHFVRLAAKT
jgi:hypothetical protein